MHNLNELLDNCIAENIAVRVGRNDEVFCTLFRGNVDENTLFDMASTTKIIATTSLALIALDKRLLSLETPISSFYKTDKPMKIKHLLTHTMGIGHKALNKEGNTYENIAEKILEIPLDFEIGTKTEYSCPGFILLGKILEKVFGQRLDNCFYRLVAEPLGMKNSRFLPTERENIINSNRDHGKLGVVNDYNCQFLGGVAGNAGLFSNVTDATKYAKMLISRGSPLFGEELFTLATQNHTEGMKDSRGLGFLFVDERYSQTGGLFQTGSVGHCGHTGQSIFVDYKTGLYAIILSDATLCTVKKYGGERYGEVINLREALHKAIKKDIES